jgi:hemerythrin-like domain-containing protein
MPQTALPDRPPRTQRPQRPQEATDGFESLDQAHRAAVAMLEIFRRLVAHLDEQGLDVTAEQLAAQVLAFFDGPGRHHHDDEERLVFPELVSLGDAELDAHVRRLRQDHHWIDQDWRELSPHVKAIAEGYNGYELPLLQAALPVFEALYFDHIALEETVVYPAARRVRAAAEARRVATA